MDVGESRRNAKGEYPVDDVRGIAGNAFLTALRTKEAKPRDLRLKCKALSMFADRPVIRIDFFRY